MNPMLKPLLSQMPDELKAIPNWVCWKGAKVPFEPSQRVKTAKVTVPSTWGSFTDAIAAYGSGKFSGVGFVLTGSGIAGVDLDNCVIDGVIDPQALKLMQELGCKYVELSPSGNGLHGFGKAEDIKGTKGVKNGINIELYTSGRYLTMTGHFICNEPLTKLVGFPELAHQLRTQINVVPANNQEGEIASVSSVTYVSSVTSVSSVGALVYPPNCIPSGLGQRNKAVFQLARFLKGMMPDADREQLKPFVRSWHTQVLPTLGTKDFDVTWIDFITAWPQVQHPHGSVISDVLKNLPEIPSWMRCADLGSKAIHLMRVCLALQAHEGDKPFFISGRVAGEIVGLHFSDACKLLALYVTEGYLTLVERGVGKKASRYRIITSF